MKFKLDENFGTRTQRIIRAAGHDVQTVRDEGLKGCKEAPINIYTMSAVSSSVV